MIFNAFMILKISFVILKFTYIPDTVHVSYPVFLIAFNCSIVVYCFGIGFQLSFTQKHEICAYIKG